MAMCTKAKEECLFQVAPRPRQNLVNSHISNKTQTSFVMIAGSKELSNNVNSVPLMKKNIKQYCLSILTSVLKKLLAKVNTTELVN